MSDGNEFQRNDAVTGNVRRPTVVSRNGGDIWAGFMHVVVQQGSFQFYIARHRGSWTGAKLECTFPHL